MGRMANSERYIETAPGVFERHARRAEPESGATDAAVELADELGVDITAVEGTGKGGKITVADVRAASEA